MTRFADIHCHSTLRPVAYYLVEQDRNDRSSVWFQKKPTLRERRQKRFPLYTQTDYTTLYSSDTKLIYLTIAPLEQGWFNTKRTVFRKIKYLIYPLILLIRAVVSFKPRILNAFIKIFVGVPFGYIRLVQNNKKYFYFDTLEKEYFYISDKNRWKHKDNSYELIRHESELSTSGARIQVILTIEGAHSFSPYNAKNFLIDRDTICGVLEHIDKIKATWEFQPFFVTLCHHFYNGLCGHVKTIYYSGVISRLFSSLLDQSEGRDTEINSYGWKVINRLLGFTGSSKGRIFIDVKHMSVVARQQYYRFVQDYNKAHPETKIPIIFSHGGYSGCKTMVELLEVPDSEKKYNSSPGDFNVCSINLADEEIRVIYASGGLIGINLDQRILSSRDIVKEASKLKDTEAIKRKWGNQVFKNIIGIANAVIEDPSVNEDQKKGIWDCICIGSDFDGMINPVDAFIWAADYCTLEERLVQEFGGWEGKSSYLGLDENVIIRKIMHDNAYDFAKKHYYSLDRQIQPEQYAIT